MAEVICSDTGEARGRELLWGVGRNGPGNNIFSYYLDPNGVVVEVSFGMERIDNDDVYVPGSWAFDSKSNVLDLWGSKPPEQYGRSLSAFCDLRLIRCKRCLEPL